MTTPAARMRAAGDEFGRGETPMGETVESIQKEVERLRKEALEALSAAADAPALQGVQDRFLGRRSGAVTGLLKSLGRLDPGVRRAMVDVVRQAREQDARAAEHIERALA